MQRTRLRYTHENDDDGVSSSRLKCGDDGGNFRCPFYIMSLCESYDFAGKRAQKMSFLFFDFLAGKFLRRRIAEVIYMFFAILKNFHEIKSAKCRNRNFCCIFSYEQKNRINCKTVCWYLNDLQF